MNSLTEVYSQLDFRSGDLLSAADSPASRISREDWVEKGEWLAAAKQAQVERVFFVDGNPVVVFAQCSEDLGGRVRAFNRAWSLARPRILFLASPGEIRVFDLAQPPVDVQDDTSWKNLRHLEVLRDVNAIASELQAFHRDNVESGRIFGDSRFGDLGNRADKALIRDLKTVRRALMEDGLSGEKLKYAHSLIGRSIFIRYLEDRGVLDEDYFQRVARQRQGWTDLLRNPVSLAGIDLSETRTSFPRVLQDKDFTYTLFQTLARDFNGDMFPDVEEEERVVENKHLQQIQGLLYGNTGPQQRLFFHAYRFDIVPLDLISSIYEEFYHSADEDQKALRKKPGSKARESGAYYTPPSLAEFVLARVLPSKTLENKPRVLDPACGSGIFLVEAFRRIVRHRRHKKKAPLEFDELKEILRNQIAGIEVNEEAARITAFSLYLAMLHYLDPPAIQGHIRQGNRLPNLLAAKNNSSPNCFHSILCANTFDIEHITSTARWRERFGDECADVVVGNPPWGAPGRNADIETKERQKILLAWCRQHKRPIGDKEPSQAFLWRSLDFLKSGGTCGMLVSAGVLFKHNKTTQSFRRQWLDEIKLTNVFNFTHVRKFFFSGAISPFVSLFFEKGAQEATPVYYWSTKQLAEVSKTQAVLHSRHDLNLLREVDLTSTWTWKSCWMTSLADCRFIMTQSAEHGTLSALVDSDNTGRGLEVASQTHDASRLQSLQFLEKTSFSRYDGLQFAEPPRRVYRFGCEGIYSGRRILFQRGIRERDADKGCLVARYVEEPFCFSNAIHGVKLSEDDIQHYKVLVGVLWSSFARYFLFMTSSNWGLWHHEAHLDELLQLPVVLDDRHPVTKRIIRVVDELRNYQPQVKDLNNPDGVPKATIERKRRNWERQLDEAVFDLYNLTDEQRDLIRDCCDVTLPFLYQPLDSVGAEPVVDKSRGDLVWIEQYAEIFAKRWAPYLPDGQEMRADLHVGAHDNMVAIEFYPADQGDAWDLTPRTDWQHVLDQLAETLPQPMGTSQIVLDGLVYLVSDDAIIIVKRNLKRLWTRSLAREDANSTLAKRMATTMQERGKK